MISNLNGSSVSRLVPKLNFSLGELDDRILPEIEVSQPVFHKTGEHPVKRDSVARHSNGAQTILT